MSAPDPMHRRPGESSLAHRSLYEYLWMGPERSLAKLARKQKRGRSDRPDAGLTQLKKWSVRWRWRDRATAYDDEQMRVDIAYRDAGRLLDQVADAEINLGLARLAKDAAGDLTVDDARKLISDGLRQKSKARTLDQSIKKTQ